MVSNWVRIFQRIDVAIVSRVITLFAIGRRFFFHCEHEIFEQRNSVSVAFLIFCTHAKAICIFFWTY